MLAPKQRCVPAHTHPRSPLETDGSEITHLASLPCVPQGVDALTLMVSTPLPDNEMLTKGHDGSNEEYEKLHLGTCELHKHHVDSSTCRWCREPAAFFLPFLMKTLILKGG